MTSREKSNNLVSDFLNFLDRFGNKPGIRGKTKAYDDILAEAKKQFHIRFDERALEAAINQRIRAGTLKGSRNRGYFFPAV